MPARPVMPIDAAPVEGGCRPRQACRRMPWLPFGAAVLVCVAVPLWVIYTQRAQDSTVQLLQRISAPAAQDAQRWLDIARSVAVGLTVAVAAAAVITGAVHAVSQSRSHNSCCGAPGPISLRTLAATEAAFGALCWLLALAFVALTAAFASWLAIAYAGDAAVGAAMQPAQEAEQDAQRAVDSATNVLRTLQAQYQLGKQQVPNEVQSTDWWRQLTGTLDQIDRDLQAAQAEAANATCADGCLNLGVLGAVADASVPQCLCILQPLMGWDRLLGQVKRNVVPAAIGVLLLYVAASWLLVHCVAACMRALRDLAVQRRQRRLEQEASLVRHGSERMMWSGAAPAGSDWPDLPRQGPGRLSKPPGSLLHQHSGGSSAHLVLSGTPPIPVMTAGPNNGSIYHEPPADIIVLADRPAPSAPSWEQPGAVHGQYIPPGGRSTSSRSFNNLPVV